MNNFTPEHLLLYLYKESSPALTRAIKAALETDWTLREKLQVMRAAHSRLETLYTSPRKQAVRAVMHYAQLSSMNIAEKLN